MNLKTRLITIGTYLILLAVIATSGFFVYEFLNKNFYQIISQSNEIISAQKNIKTENINIDGFNKALNNLTEKRLESVEKNNITNPF